MKRLFHESGVARLVPAAFFLAFAALLLDACSGGGSNSSSGGKTLITPTNPDTYVQFNPSKQIMPYPNNLMFQGSEDGTLNQPYDHNASSAGVYAALDTLDGFSTIAPITADFSVEADGSSIAAGVTVRMFEVSLAGTGGAVTAVKRELSTSEYTVGLDNGTPKGLVITPAQALSPRTSYMVIMTNGIVDLQGNPFAASAHYALTKSTVPLVDGNNASAVAHVSDEDAQALEAIRPLTNAAENAAVAFDSTLERDDIVLSWSFTTQSIDDTLQAVRAAVNNAPPPPTSLQHFMLRDTPGGRGSVYVGTITLPYYSAVPTADDPTAPLHGYWHGAGGSFLTHDNPMPVATVVHDIPLLVTIPKTAKPANGWPVVIFQHGNTSNRAALMSIADKIVTAGFAAAAIDLPMHGITGDEVDGSQLLRQPGHERTFDLDLRDNVTDLPVPDGVIDTSGSYFTKLDQLLTTRDNMRQGVADLLSLRRALETMDYDGGGPDFDTSAVRFIGHSLGATVGSVYLGVETNVAAATLGMPGGGLAKQMDGSATTGPSIATGMATNDIIKGTPDYERFLAAVQMVLDSADPLNYARGAVNARPLHVIEVVGSNTRNPPTLPDQIVPNNVLNVPDTVPSPTAGTDPLWRAMGLGIASTSTSGSQLHVVVRFNAGHHSSLISSFDALGNVDSLSAAVEQEMQSEIVSFMVSNGTQLTITDTSVISPD